MTAKKKMLLSTSLVVVGLAAIFLTWVLGESEFRPDRVTVRCTGLVTNSNGPRESYVISNQNHYAIVIENYFVGDPMNWFFNGPTPPEIVLPAGCHTNVTTPRHRNPKPQEEFLVLYRTRTFRHRLWDYAETHHFSRWLPIAWATVPADDQAECFLCPQ